MTPFSISRSRGTEMARVSRPERRRRSAARVTFSVLGEPPSRPGTPARIGSAARQRARYIASSCSLAAGHSGGHRRRVDASSPAPGSARRSRGAAEQLEEVGMTRASPTTAARASSAQVTSRAAAGAVSAVGGIGVAEDVEGHEGAALAEGGGPGQRLGGHRQSGGDHRQGVVVALAVEVLHRVEQRGHVVGGGRMELVEERPEPRATALADRDRGLVQQVLQGGDRRRTGHGGRASPPTTEVAPAPWRRGRRARC